ncbi:ShlB/FhaC/HecB family hemolysin secretion/activation protein [Serratia sp. (in: enterobacteria)]|uniref:ShlB/FhaC/HecB family hemolysin secretion/activation protein n=1 Tax=Serratia sp. (in: enterobacteria) TaxID=616 RepID=UPI003989C901
MQVRFSASVLLALLIPAAQGAENAQLIEQQVSHQQEQDKARYDQLATQGKDIRAADAGSQSSRIVFPQEPACFEIQQVILNKDAQIPRWLPLQKLTVQAEGRCLGIEGVRTLATALQNKLIRHGYITTRVVVPPQDLKQGVLTLTVLSGVIGNISFSADSDKYANLSTTFPGHSGDLLDLRAIEQGLENIQRIPGADANVILRPGEQAGGTDIEIQRTQPSFWRVGGWFDDSGSKYTGRYQSGVALYLDNPTSLNDLFYVAIGRDLHFQNQRNSKNGSLYYSVPFGFWSVDMYASRSEYLQNIAGIWTDFQYQGTSDNLSLKVNRLLYRNANQKTTFSLQLLKNRSHYYLNETKIDIQDRNVTNAIARLNHRHYVGQSTVDAMVGYQRNTSWFGAQQQAGARSPSRIVNLDLSARVPFTLFGQSMSYQPRYQQQYSPDALAIQDQFSLGNRWTVRGFDGEFNLAANKGYSLRNDVNLNLPRLNQQLYAGIDYGKVSGRNGNFTSGHLAGGVIGIRGGLGAVSYDAFAGIPLSKPDNFTTSPVSLGFTLQWQL